MFKPIVHTMAATVGIAATAAWVGAIAPLSAQAATFDYTSNLTVEATGNPTPVLSSNYSYTKTDLAPGSVGYKLLSFSASVSTPFLSQTYTLADLPTFVSLANQFSALLPAQYQPAYQKYQVILANYLSGATYDYIGDGGFPPSDFSYAFSAQSVPHVSVLPQLFPAGGTLSYSSTVDGAVLPDLGTLPGLGTDSQVSATPEPTTMLGIGLASAGLAAARRRKAKQTMS